MQTVSLVRCTPCGSLLQMTQPNMMPSVSVTITGCDLACCIYCECLWNTIDLRIERSRTAAASWTACRLQLVSSVGMATSVVAVKWHERTNQILLGTGEAELVLSVAALGGCCWNAL